MDWSPEVTEAFCDRADHIHVIARLGWAIRYARCGSAGSSRAMSMKFASTLGEGHGMARADILVINPNSNPAVTAGLDAALGTLRLADGPSIRCMTLCEGPFGIESQQDVEQVALPLRRLVE